MLSALLGAGAVVGGYLVYIAATKGVPAAWAKIKGWWNAGKADLAAVKNDVAALKADVGALKSKVGV